MFSSGTELLLTFARPWFVRGCFSSLNIGPERGAVLERGMGGRWDARD